ncbi:MAG: ATP-binding protein [Bacteroidetes bacterium]|nr:ATP-binding protein [Bacteroidota bacterium]
MSNERFHKVILDQKEEIALHREETLANREFEHLVTIESQLAQIIIGVRRSGKSTLAHQVCRDLNYAYLNFDDERLMDCSQEDLNLLLELLFQEYGDFKYLILDEIQNIDGWSLFVNRLLRAKLHIIVTGSNSKLLNVELASHMTGRFSTTELFPFSFREFLEFRKFQIASGTTKETGILNSLFREYCKTGGFPEVLHGELAESYITDLFNAIVTRDIVFRHNIKYVRTFRDIARFLVNNYSTELSFNRIKTIFELGSENTAKQYVSYLEEAYLILTLPKFSFKKQEQLRYRKVYTIDPGFISVLSDEFAENRGRILENIVFLELRRKAMLMNYEIFYYKKQFEIDFVIFSKGKVTELIQVSKSLLDKKTLNREVRALILASNELKPKKLRIITENEESTIEQDDQQIEVIPVLKWLLSEQFLYSKDPNQEN